MLCRSEARKIEQKELVMEGGVVGIGVNLVRPSLMVMKLSCACCLCSSNSCSTAFAQSDWSQCITSLAASQHVLPSSTPFFIVDQGLHCWHCRDLLQLLWCHCYCVYICRITVVADLSSISTPCYNKAHMCMWRIGMVAMDP